MVCLFLVIFVVRLFSASVQCNYKYSFVIVLHHENNFIFKYSQLFDAKIYQIYIYGSESGALKISNIKKLIIMIITTKSSLQIKRFAPPQNH